MIWVLGLNSDSYVCMANTSPAELSPQSSKMVPFFFSYPLLSQSSKWQPACKARIFFHWNDIYCVSPTCKVPVWDWSFLTAPSSPSSMGLPSECLRGDTWTKIQPLRGVSQGKSQARGFQIEGTTATKTRQSNLIAQGSGWEGGGEGWGLLHWEACRYLARKASTK